MPNLTKRFVVRPAEQLTPQQIDAIALPSHPSFLQSSQYGSWVGLCEADSYEQLVSSVSAFLQGEAAIRSMDKIPEALRAPLEFAQYRGFDFSMTDFMNTVDLVELRKAVGPRDTNGKLDPDLDFFKVFANLADQLVGESVVPVAPKRGALDKQNLLKTMYLLLEIAESTNQQGPELNLRRMYAKPMLLEHCLPLMDPCSGRVRSEEQQREQDDKCECECDDACVEQDECCAPIVPYVADLYVVRDQIDRYNVGDMSYIENILESEIKERTHRHLEREELRLEQEETTSSFEEKDHQVDERFSLQKEIDKVVAQEISVDAGVTVHQKWGTGDLTATTDFGFNQTKADTQKSVEEYSRDIIEKSVSRLEKKIRTLSAQNFLRETEETNRHVFGGETGAPNDMSRQFYYVNQVKKAQMYNYGKREMIDLFLPEPAEMYKRLIAKQFQLEEPVPPTLIELDPKTITPENYLEIAATYGLTDVPAPPDFTKQVVHNLSGAPGDPKGKNKKSGSHIFNFPCIIPTNYVGVSMAATIIQLNYNQDGGVSISAVLGPAGNSVWHQDGGAMSLTSPLPDIEGTHNVVVHTWDVTEFTWNLTVNLELKDEFKTEWQLSVYELIVEANAEATAAYEAALAEYEAGIAQFEAVKLARYNQNPFVLLQEMQEQLKQAAISYISCQFYDKFSAMKNKVEPCGFPQMNIPQAKREGDVIRFFEQAFEWKFMNFLFYPYFWSRKCTWVDKVGEQSDNVLFERFLKAGSARVSIPVRPGFENHVNYFLATGTIWSGTGIPPVTGPDFVPIYQEIKEDKENFNTDREGKLDVTNGSPTVLLTDTDQYWNYGGTGVPAGVDTDAIALDIDREIFIDCKAYRIVDIQQTTVGDPMSWTITLERDYEGDTASNLFWSTGALFVGAPWEFNLPTRLVWLREDSACLPEYPIDCTP